MITYNLDGSINKLIWENDLEIKFSGNEMRTIYLDCGMGAAGDMLMAALLELCPEKQEEFLGKMNGLGLPGVKVEAEPAVKCGITGTHMNVTVFGEEEESEDVRDHGHAHTHSHEACEPIAADGLHSHLVIEERGFFDGRFEESIPSLQLQESIEYVPAGVCHW